MELEIWKLWKELHYSTPSIPTYSNQPLSRFIPPWLSARSHPNSIAIPTGQGLANLLLHEEVPTDGFFPKGCKVGGKATWET